VTVRERRTKAQMTTLRRQMSGALKNDHPQSVRHVFYLETNPTLEEWVEKSDAGYVTVQRTLVAMRREGLIPYGWITDATRQGYFTQTWNDPADAVAHVASLYRRSYWATAPVYLEVWCESRSIAGVIRGDCERYAVPLYPAGGFASLSLTWRAAQHIAGEAARPIAGLARGRPVHVLYVGDYDPAGLLIDRNIEAELRRHLPDTEIHFHRLAITAEQIVLMGLPTKPAKEGDRRGGFTGGTVEAEAMPAGVLRGLLRDAIEKFIDPRELAALKAAEESERYWLYTFAREMQEGTL